MSQQDKFDLCVIGGGSGGMRAARLAAQAGMRVALFEKSHLGGTCIIRGCVPKKFLVYASRYRDDLALSGSLGWNIAAANFHWATLRDAVQAEVMRLSGIYARTLATHGVEFIEGEASFLSANTISGGGRTVEAERTIIAVGCEPARPNVTGIENAIISDDVFVMEQLPASMVVVGAGYIALEFACLLQRLGVAVTLIHRGEHLLRGFDADMRNHITQAMREAGVDILLNTTVSAIKRLASGEIELSTGNGTLRTGEVFYATGRGALTQGLNCDAAGVALNKRGFIAVDEHSCTTAGNIFAVGDVTGRMQLTPVAIREAANVIDHISGGAPKAVDYQNVPTAIFTTPEMGTVGLNEEAARQSHDIEVYLATLRPMKLALSSSKERALLKLVVDKTTRRVLGVHICCEAAGELIQLLGVLVMRGITKEELDEVVAVHPTLAEELVTMREPTR